MTSDDRWKLCEILRLHLHKQKLWPRKRLTPITQPLLRSDGVIQDMLLWNIVARKPNLKSEVYSDLSQD